VVVVERTAAVQVRTVLAQHHTARLGQALHRHFRLSRSITPSGMRAMPRVPFQFRVFDVARLTVLGIEH